MTDEQFDNWLGSNEKTLVTLVEVSPVHPGTGQAVPTYLSSRPYSGSSLSGAVTQYLPVVVGGMEFTGDIPLDGSASISYGDIEVENGSGEFDHWLSLVWGMTPVTVLIGDLSWQLQHFRVVFTGVVGSLESRSSSTLNLTIFDNLQKANTPISEAKIGGTLSNKDELLPVTLGECFNVEPVLVNPAQLEYAVNPRGVQAILSVRDNGVPVAVYETGYGRFKLSASPAGQITASVVGDVGGAGGQGPFTPGSLTKLLLSDYGSTYSKFQPSDFDDQSFTQLDTDKPYTVGIYMRDRKNLLATCQEILSSVSAHLVCHSTGKLRVVRLFDDAPPAVAFGQSDIVSGTLEIPEIPPVQTTVNLDYNRNWTVQSSGLATSLAPEAAELLGKEWLTATASAPQTVVALHKRTEEPKHQQTALAKRVDAESEAQHRLAFWSVQRKVIQAEFLHRALMVELGDRVLVQHSRFGLAEGAVGTVTHVSRSWVKGTVTLGILI